MVAQGPEWLRDVVPTIQLDRLRGQVGDLTLRFAGQKEKPLTGGASGCTMQLRGAYTLQITGLRLAIAGQVLVGDSRHRRCPARRYRSTGKRLLAANPDDVLVRAESSVNRQGVRRDLRVGAIAEGSGYVTNAGRSNGRYILTSHSASKVHAAGRIITK